MNIQIFCADRGSTYPHKLGRYFVETDYAEIALDLLERVDLIRNSGINDNPCVVWWCPPGMNQAGELMPDFRHVPEKLEQYIQAHRLLEKNGVESICYVGPGAGEHAKTYDASAYAGWDKIPGTIIVDSAGYYANPYHPDVIYIKSNINVRTWGVEGGPSSHWQGLEVDALIDVGNVAALQEFSHAPIRGRKFIMTNDRPNWKTQTPAQMAALARVGFKILVHHFHVNAKSVGEWKNS